jgi:hypothetical protein
MEAGGRDIEIALMPIIPASKAKRLIHKINPIEPGGVQGAFRVAVSKGRT